jgi:hypothetical protein
MRIDHAKQVAFQITQQVASDEAELKECCFYLIFKDKTRKRLKKKILDYKNVTNSFSNGWLLYDCKYLQQEALINTRLYDVPSLQYHKSALKLLKSGVMSTAGSRAAGQSLISASPIISAIDQKILTTSLGLSYPFFARASVASETT